MTEMEIEFTTRGSLGLVRLNRPKALNALTLGMCDAMSAQLDRWAADSAVQAVLVRGAGDRAFCAGGDIRKLYEEGKAGGSYPFDFFKAEYRTNAKIKRFPKPYIALMDGIVMGGGVGFSVHGTRRIVTENTVFAMPETGIGMFPDVGGSYFLPRCPGQIGMYLALTGARIKAADAIYCEVGDMQVPSARLDQLVEALAGADLSGGLYTIDAIAHRFAVDAEAAPLASHRALIDHVFSETSVEGILHRLASAPDIFAAETLAVLRTKSPTSMKISFAQLRRGMDLSMDECMRLEWRIANRIMAGHDFYSGVRALIIDKDNRPAWQPAMLEDVQVEDIARYFAPLPGNELPIP